jgi:hypothetical protein
MHNSLKDEYAFTFMGVINEVELDFEVDKWSFVTKDPPDRLNSNVDDGLDLFFDRWHPVNIMSVDDGWRRGPFGWHEVDHKPRRVRRINFKRDL